MTRYKWDAIDERFSWVAKDANGMVEAYRERPILKEFWWYSGSATEILGYAAPWEDHSDWRESLEERPKPPTRYHLDHNRCAASGIIDTTTDNVMTFGEVLDLLNERSEASDDRRE